MEGIKRIIHINKWWWGRKDTIILDNGIAFCNLEFPTYEEYAWVDSVSVHPKYRRQGYGNRLLDLCIERAKKEGKEIMRLVVDSDWAQNWYERRGFKQIGLNPDGLPLMELKIS